MTDAKKCPKCDAEIPTDAPAGICPKCLLAAGLAGDTGLRAEASDETPTTPLPSSSRFVPPSPQELAPFFPQLEILELIGAGGMGAVYKARQPGLDRLVAVKILPPEVGADPSFALRFTREAQALARLGHQHIVSVYDFGTSGGLYYFIMEYVDGANLRQVIRAGELPSAQALAIVPQICEALQFAHDEGIVHRDIKPENILIDKRGRVKIADFGLARLLGGGGPNLSLTGTNQVLGTLHYMAPEQLQGLRNVDHRADIYSLGVVFYEMLTGELPLGRFEPPSQKVAVDVRLDEVVLRSLESAPERRYQQANEVKTEVERISQDGAEVLAAQSDDLPTSTGRDNGPERIRSGTSKLHSVAHVANAMLVLGGLTLLSIPLVAGLTIDRVEQSFGTSPDDKRKAVVAVVYITGWYSAAAVPQAFVLIAAALAMRSYRWYRLAIAASILAMLPMSILWPISLPIGLWGLAVLTTPRARGAFRDQNVQIANVKPQPGSRDHAKAQEIDEEQRAAELAEIAPDWLAYAAMGLLALGWIFIGLMWNFRLAGVAIAIFVMALICYGVVRWKLVYLPKLRREIARQPDWKITSSLVIAFLWFALGVVCVIGGQVGLADLVMKPRHFTFSDMATVRAQGALRLAHFDGLSEENSRLWMQGGRFDPVPWSSVMMSWLMGVSLLFTAVCTMIHTRLYRYTWKHWWAPSLSVVIGLLTTLMLVHFAHLVIVRHGTSNPKEREIHFTATRDSVDTAIDRWATEKDYMELSFQDWDIEKDGTGVGHVHVRHLLPRSWFDRYRSSWKYMILRPHPPLYITVVTRDSPADAYVRVELPSYTKNSPEEAMWSMLLDEMESRVRGLATDVSNTSLPR